jgi:uncharacterized protein (TIGR02646 family)
VKYIKKSEEPEAFSAWKALQNEDWQPSWGNFQKPEKDTVQEALLKEQGYICCYCERRIDERKNSHIEHLKPRTLYPDLQLEYANLLASCQGESETPPPIPVHCGHQKRDWYEENLMVSPLDLNCAEFFRYSGAGEILPIDDPDRQAMAETTIEYLGLNIAKLQAMRGEAIAGVLLAIDGLTEEEIRLFAEGCEQLDRDGRHRPFCTAISYILNSYFSPNSGTTA